MRMPPIVRAKKWPIMIAVIGALAKNWAILYFAYPKCEGVRKMMLRALGGGELKGDTQSTAVDCISRGCAEFCVNGISFKPASSVLQTEL
jgi:hypothetical protein